MCENFSVVRRWKIETNSLMTFFTTTNSVWTINYNELDDWSNGISEIGKGHDKWLNVFSAEGSVVCVIVQYRKLFSDSMALLTHRIAGYKGNRDHSTVDNSLGVAGTRNDGKIKWARWYVPSGERNPAIRDAAFLLPIFIPLRILFVQFRFIGL